MPVNTINALNAKSRKVKGSLTKTYALKHLILIMFFHFPNKIQAAKV